MFNRAGVDEAAALIKRKGGVVALTGAGISVDSGIPDFRSPGGLWEKFDPAEYATLSAFTRDPAKVWKLFRELDEPLAKARPNRGHRALADLERKGYLTAVITQNIDNLHTAAGNTRVIELHGTTGRLRCIRCRETYARETVARNTLGFPPVCPCGGLVKPDVILFEEQLPEDAIRGAFEAAAGAKILLTVGTSGLVMPANTVPTVAKRHGADVIEVNIEETVLTSSVTDYFVQGSSSDVLPAIVRAL